MSININLRFIRVDHHVRPFFDINSLLMAHMYISASTTNVSRVWRMETRRALQFFSANQNAAASCSGYLLSCVSKLGHIRQHTHRLYPPLPNMERDQAAKEQQANRSPAADSWIPAEASPQHQLDDSFHPETFVNVG